METFPNSVVGAAVNRLRSSQSGRTLATAQPLGSFPGKRTVRNAVSRNRANFYRFTLDNLSNVRLSFRNRAVNSMTSAILNEQGQVVSLGKNRLSQRIKAGDSIERTYRQLPSGTYVLRVVSRSKGENAYRLTLAASNTSRDFPGCGCGRSS
jgi:hypothetical protein